MLPRYAHAIFADPSPVPSHPPVAGSMATQQKTEADASLQMLDEDDDFEEFEDAGGWMVAFHNPHGCDYGSSVPSP